MNERIADLLEQAFDRCKKYDDEGQTGLVKTTEALSIFAELIIQECMNCSTWVGEVNKNPVKPIHTAYAINKRIKKHFGV
jgi:hypothetical protein